jgi:hypothetical protein
MAQREKIFDLDFISDHSCGSYYIGEIDTYPDEAIKKYLERFGAQGHKDLNNFFDRCKAVVWNWDWDMKTKNMNDAGSEAKQI